jgi:hypothetical protein
MSGIISGVGVIIEEYISVMPGYRLVAGLSGIVIGPVFFICKYFFPNLSGLIFAILVFLISLFLWGFFLLVLAFLLRTFFGMKTQLCQHCGQIMESKWQACKSCGQFNENK